MQPKGLVMVSSIWTMVRLEFLAVLLVLKEGTDRIADKDNLEKEMVCSTVTRVCPVPTMMVP
jgi:hypothetical protein